MPLTVKHVPDFPTPRFTVSPLRLPASAYLKTDRVENIQWYGAGKLHPTLLGDTLDGNRFRIVAKLDHDGQSLSWLCRDTVKDEWCRIDIFHASEEVTTFALRAASTALHQREVTTTPPAVQSPADVVAATAYLDAKGLPTHIFYHTGPNGHHLCVVCPLQGAWNCFRWSLDPRDARKMDQDWFVKECKKMREQKGMKENELPGSVHEILEGEMVRILYGGGRPELIVVTGELWEWVKGRKEEQVPAYVVLRPGRIEEGGSDEEDSEEGEYESEEYESEDEEDEVEWSQEEE